MWTNIEKCLENSKKCVWKKCNLLLPDQRRFLLAPLPVVVAARGADDHELAPAVGVAGLQGDGEHHLVLGLQQQRGHAVILLAV